MYILGTMLLEMITVGFRGFQTKEVDYLQDTFVDT